MSFSVSRILLISLVLLACVVGVVFSVWYWSVSKPDDCLPPMSIEYERLLNKSKAEALSSGQGEKTGSYSRMTAEEKDKFFELDKEYLKQISESCGYTLLGE